MSIDVGAILDGVGPLIESAIVTMGTEVSIFRDPEGVQDRETDPLTLSDVETSAETPIATGVPVLWGAEQTAATQETGANLYQGRQRVRVVGLPSLVDVQVFDVLEVTTSRDPRLVGRSTRAKVLAVPDAAAGAVRVMDCEVLP